MVDLVIITLLDKDGTEIGDFELPARMKVSELSVKIEEALKAMNSDKYSEISNLKLLYEDAPLSAKDTLYIKEIWDGSFLKLAY